MGILDDIIGNQDAAAFLRARGLLGRGGQDWAPPQEIAGKVAAQAGPRSYGVPGRQQAGWMPPQEIQVNAPPSMINPNMQFAQSTMDFSDPRMAQPQQPQQATQLSQGMPSLVGTPFPQQQPDEGPQVDLSKVSPEQRQMEATTAGTPQDTQSSFRLPDFDLAGFGNRLAANPLFNLGVGILSNPENIGQGLATGLQSMRAGQESATRQKLAEKAANRKNIHWGTNSRGEIIGIDPENPNQIITPAGQEPRPEAQIIQPGQEGSIPGHIIVKSPTGAISVHPLPQTPEQKLADVEAEAAARARGKASVDGGGAPGAPKMTDFDKKAIKEADDALSLGKTSMGAIKEARELSKGASQNPVSAFFAPGASAAGADWGKKTERLRNILTGEGLNNLKAAFGGNPTEGERKVQLELMGAMDQPDDVRQSIFNNYERALKDRMNYNILKSRALRDRSYYDPNSEFYKKFQEYINAESVMPGAETPQASGSVQTNQQQIIQQLPQGAQQHSDGYYYWQENGKWKRAKAQ